MWRCAWGGLRHAEFEFAVKNYQNPRKEMEEHYYNPKYTGLLELGLEPNFLTNAVIQQMLEKIIQYKKNIVIERILPRVSWSN